MIEFTGSLTGAAKTAFLLKQRKTGILIFAIAFPLILPLIFFIGNEVFHDPQFNYIMGGGIFIICALLVTRPMSQKEIEAIMPQRIYANKNHIVCIAEQYKESKPVTDVLQVIDCGSYYDIRFPFGKLSDKFICQKDLLTKGSLEKFEELFEGKIRRR